MHYHVNGHGRSIQNSLDALSLIFEIISNPNLGVFLFLDIYFELGCVDSL